MARVRIVDQKTEEESPANVRKSGRSRRAPSSQKDYVTVQFGVKATPPTSASKKSTFSSLKRATTQETPAATKSAAKPARKRALKESSENMSGPSAKRARVPSEVEQDPLSLHDMNVEVVEQQKVDEESEGSDSPRETYLIYLQMHELRLQDVAQRLPPPAPYHARLNDFVTRFFPHVKFEEKSEAAFNQELAKGRTEEITWVDEPFRKTHFLLKRVVGTAKKEKIVELTYMCSICRQTFSPRYKFFKHVLMHSKCFVVTCDVCDEDFNDLDRLLSHRKKHTPEDGVKYMCDNCPEKFPNTRALYAHREAQHLPLKPTCRVCKKVFHVRDDLVEHMKSHEGPFVYCVVCNREFSSRYEHNVHEFHCMKNLPGTTCEMCDMRFCCFTDLRKHEEEFHDIIHCGRIKYNFNIPPIKYTSP